MGAELDRFDAVCLATALHRMAALGAPPERCAAAVERREFARLTSAVGARLPLLCPLPCSSVSCACTTNRSLCGKVAKVKCCTTQ